MKVTIKRWKSEKAYSSVFDMPPLHWLMTTEGKVFVSCENGHAARIADPQMLAGEGWEISAEGEVTPSIHCLTTTGPNHDDECGWHVFAVLEGWSE